MSNKIFYFSFCGLVAGVFVSSFVRVGFSFGLFLILIALVFILYTFFEYKKYKLLHIPLTQNIKILILLGVFILFAGLGVLRYAFVDKVETDYFLDKQIGKKVLIEAIIGEEPEDKENSQRAVADLNFLVLSKSSDLKEKVSGRAIMSLSRFPQISYGDKVFLTGTLAKPKNFLTDSGREFDYVSYLSKNDIKYELKFAEVEIISSGEGSFLKRNLFAIKNIFLEKTGEIFPEPQASLLGGLLVGAKKSLPTNLLDDFKKSGIIHIVVLSGYNVSIIASAIMAILSFLPMFLSLFFGALSIVFFAVMTGGGATVVRACIMALLAIFARSIGRMYDVSRALFVAGFLMIMQNPKILAFDPSFQLSFTATFGVLYFYPAVKNYFSFIPEKNGLRDAVGLTISTQIFLMPLLVFMTGNLSLVALPVNILVLPMVPFAMFGGFISGVLGFVSYVFAFPFVFISNIILSCIIFIPEISASFSFATVQIKNIPIIFLLGAYVFYGFIIAKNSKKIK